MGELLELLDNWEGYRSLRDERLSEVALARTLDLITNAAGMPVYRQQYLLREAITTSDFPNLFGGLLDRQLMARYKVAMPDWRAYCPTGTLPDFREAKLHKVQGQDNKLDPVAEGAEYPLATISEAAYTRKVTKRGRQFEISWEAVVNDALGAFNDLVDRFLEAALLTEAWEVTSLYCSSTGPNPALFGAPITDVDGGQVTNLGNLNLTVDNLATTLGLMAAQRDVNGRPLGIRGVHLVVPPMLEVVARQVLTSTEVVRVDPTGTIQFGTANVLPQMGLKLHVDPLIPVVMPTANANKTWFVFADPAQGRAIQMDFLRGHEAPEICMKASDKVSTGGGLISPLEGDFETDSVRWRVRHVLGGARLDPRCAYCQVGS